MISISDYSNPFRAVADFEKAVCDFTGAPYCVVTDRCTHAIEICLRYDKVSTCEFTCHTYLSVLMTMHKLGVKYSLRDEPWRGEYHLHGTRIWDSARRFEHDMYRPGTLQCLSFGRTKPLEIGQGGCILTDDQKFAERASRMRYDGRDILKFHPWADQQTFELGFHYFMRPEDCVTGINILNSGHLVQQIDSFYNYPDCRTIIINA
jgi:dTDP-4-amino-4,6-dideoxygalactose transaminase